MVRYFTWYLEQGKGGRRERNREPNRVQIIGFDYIIGYGKFDYTKLWTRVS